MRKSEIEGKESRLMHPRRTVPLPSAPWAALVLVLLVQCDGRIISDVPEQPRPGMSNPAPGTPPSSSTPPLTPTGMTPPGTGTPEGPTTPPRPDPADRRRLVPGPRRPHQRPRRSARPGPGLVACSWSGRGRAGRLRQAGRRCRRRRARPCATPRSSKDGRSSRAYTSPPKPGSPRAGCARCCRLTYGDRPSSRSRMPR